VRKISHPPGFDTRAFQPVASRLSGRFKCKTVPVTTMTANNVGGAEVYLHSLYTSVLHGGELQNSRLGRLIPGNQSACVGERGKSLAPTGIRITDCPIDSPVTTCAQYSSSCNPAPVSFTDLLTAGGWTNGLRPSYSGKGHSSDAHRIPV
jgi:hypothetical protein